MPSMDLHGLEEGRLNYSLVLQIPSKLFEPPNISGAWSCRGQPHDFGVHIDTFPEPQCPAQPISRILLSRDVAHGLRKKDT